VDILKQRLLEVNPDIQVKISREKITEENATSFFGDAEILFEAFDKPENKKLFLEAYSDGKKLLIMGNGMAGSSNASEIKIKKINEKLFIVGDQISSISNLPVFAPRVAVCAGLMASVGLEYSLR